MNTFLKRLASDIVSKTKLSFGFAFGIDLVSNIQMVYLIVKTTFDFQSENKGPVLRSAANILHFVEETISIDYSNQLYLLFVLLGYFLIHFAIFLLLILLKTYREETNAKKLLQIMGHVYLLHSRVICAVINYLLAEIINYQNNCNTNIGDGLCANVWLILSIFIVTINVSLALVQELFLYSAIKNKNCYAVKNNTFHGIIFFQKTLSIFLDYLLADTSLATQITSVSNFILVSIALGVLHIKLPFYNMVILKESIIATIIGITSSFISLLRIIGLSQDALEIAWIFLILLALKIYFACLNSLFCEILRGNFNSPEKALHYIILLKKNKFGYISPFFLDQKLALKSLVINGNLSGNNEDRTRLMSSKTKTEYESKIYAKVQSNLEKVLESHPKSELLLLSMAQIYLKKLKNIPKAIALIKKFESLTVSIWANNSLEDLKGVINRLFSKQHVLNSSKDALNIMKYFDCRDNAQSIKENVLEEVEKHLDFWAEISNDRVNVKKVTTITNKINSLSHKIMKKQQKEGDYLGSYFANFLVLFGVYLEIIQESLQDSKKFIFKFTNLNHRHFGQSFDIYHDKEAAVVVSVGKEGFGTIIDASGSFQSLFRLTKDQIINKSLPLLLPSIAINHLLKMIDNYSEAIEGGNKFVTFAKIKNGRMFEAEIELLLHPDIEKGINAVILFRRISSPKYIMMINSNGVVLECADKLQTKLNFPKVYSSPIELQDVVSDYEHINTIFKFTSGEKERTQQRLLTSRRVTSAKTINYNYFETSKQNLMILDELGKNQQGDALHTSPKINRSESQETQNPTNKPSITSQSEIKMNTPEKTKQILSFMPLHSPDGKTQFTLNVEVKTHMIGTDTYKVLGLTNETDKAESKGFTKGIDSTVNESASHKHEDELNFKVGEDDDELAIKKTSNPKETLAVKENLKSPKSDQFSPKSSHPLMANTNIDQKLMRLVTKKVQNRKALSTKGKKTGGENSIGSTSSGNLLSIKALKNLLSEHSGSSLKKLGFSIYIIIIFMGCLGGVNLYFSQKSLEEINTGIMIVNYATLRLSESLRGWQLATRFFFRHFKLRTGGSIPMLKTSITQKGERMIQMNKELSHEVSSQISNDLLQEIYRKDISLWELYENNKFNSDKTDTFVSTKLLASKLTFIGNTSLDYESPTVLNALQYVVNNTANDYLISSENMISVTQNVLRSIIKDNISVLQVMLGIECAALIILCLSLIISAKVILNIYHSLFNALTKIDNYHIENRVFLLHKLKIVLMQDIETKEFGLNALDLLSLPTDGYHSKFEKDSRRNRRNSEPDFKGFTFLLAKVVGISLVIIQLVTCLYIASLSQSISNFQTLEQVNDQLYVTTRAGYRISMIIGVFYTELCFRNDTTMLIRNEAPRIQLKKVLNELRQVNEELMEVFHEEGVGVTDSFVKNYLKDGICAHLTIYVQGSCRSATLTPDKELGLVDFNSKLLQIEEYFIDVHFSNPTYANAKRFGETYASTLRQTTDTLDQAYDVLNSYIIGSFREKKNLYLARTTYLYLAIVASLLISLVVIQGISIRKLKSLDICRGHILRTVSCRIILENKSLKFYLNKHFLTKMAKLR